jgi:multiple sugar transport system substrate-binding protein
VYYNKKLFNEVGISYPTDDWDWNQFLDKAEKLTKIGEGRVTQYGFYGWAWQNFVYSNGGKMVDNVENPTRFTLNESRALEGLQFYTDLMYKYKVMPSSVDIKNLGIGVQQMFIMGRIGMFCSGIWETPIFRKIKDFEWDVVMFPKGLSGERGFGTGGSAYCILKTTQHPKEAWEVVKALTGEKGQIMLAETGLAQPANRKIAEGVYWAESPKLPLNKKMLNEAVKYVVYEPFHPQWREAQELYINPQLDLVFNNETTPKEALDKIESEVNKLLKNE